MGSTLWLDLTPLWWKRGQTLEGISRTVFVYARGLRDVFPSVRFCRYETEKQAFFPLSADEVGELLDSFRIHAQTCQEALQPSAPASAPALVFRVWGRIAPWLPPRLRPIPGKCKRWLLALLYKKGQVGHVPCACLPVEPVPAGGIGPHARLELSRGDVLCIMGLLWCQVPWERLRRERDALGFHIVTVIHDLIPVLFPEMLGNAIEDLHCRRVLEASSLVYTVSDYTSEDVRRFAVRHDLPEPLLRRIHHGADLPCPPPSTRPSRFAGLPDGGFVLYVSSLNHRKNHAMLYALWREMYETDRESLLPLVLVGERTEYAAPLLDLMHATKRLYPHYLRHEQNVSDEELQWLYVHCRFTVFPSLYEGWGLPVVESLQHGKVCLSSDASSLPEAGAGCAELLRPFDYYGWKEALVRYMTDDVLLADKEAAIRRRFHGATWEEGVARFAASLSEVFPGLAAPSTEEATCA